MKMLYIGDIMAEPGYTAVAKVLPALKQEHQIDFVIAQAENSNHVGKGPGIADIERMQALGIDFFTGGNHSLTGEASTELYQNPDAPVIRPANLLSDLGAGYKVVPTSQGNILVASMLGQTVGKPIEIANPLTTIDTIIEETKDQNIVARIVNLHGDFSSEKRVFGYYLDGVFSAVLGDHWHVPTADAMVLPKGTAHMTDVGMCGTLHSSLGVPIEIIVDRWKNNGLRKNEIELHGPLQFNAALIDIDTQTGLSRSITHIQRIIDQDD